MLSSKRSLWDQHSSNIATSSKRSRWRDDDKHLYMPVAVHIEVPVDRSFLAMVAVGSKIVIATHAFHEDSPVFMYDTGTSFMATGPRPTTTLMLGIMVPVDGRRLYALDPRSTSKHYLQTVAETAEAETHGVAAAYKRECACDGRRLPVPAFQAKLRRPATLQQLGHAARRPLAAGAWGPRAATRGWVDEGTRRRGAATSREGGKGAKGSCRQQQGARQELSN
uniref:Uncharacterized protein n=1 Tax=Oryza sativa subsp. japonica TaxID=39947 RepID=Q6K9E6_ORYSJ|nr:hypothetical protein [Oryza sativa Japonica Group]